MKKFALLFIAVLSGQLFAGELTYLEGRYACKITYTDRPGLSIPAGEDFPVGDFHAPTIERSEVLLVDFNGANAKVVNPSVLPSYLFITADQADQQTSFSYFAADERSIIYEVEWNNTWYFGSQVMLETVSKPANGKVKMHITFDDNDGWAQTLDYVGCKKVKL